MCNCVAGENRIVSSENGSGFRKAAHPNQRFRGVPSPPLPPQEKDRQPGGVLLYPCPKEDTTQRRFENENLRTQTERGHSGAKRTAPVRSYKESNSEAN